jgi:hypoxanthine phosphoribosyltransferase
MTEPLEILISRAAIRERLKELGGCITRDFEQKNLCIMPVMDGVMIFAADLVREIQLSLTITPIKASSYGNGTSSSGTITLPWGMPEGIEEKDLLLVDDILDTGLTLRILTDRLLEQGAKSVSTCALLRKESSRHLPADYLGFDIPDKFVVGYGLDHAGLHRNLADIAVLA